MTRIAEASPSLRARIAGLFYFLTFLTGGLAVAFTGKIIISGDAAATMNNILAHEPAFWFGFAAYLAVIVCYIVVTALFYDLFKPVNESISLLATFFSLVGCTIQAFAAAFFAIPVLLLKDPQYLHVFKVEELQVLAFMFLKLYGPAYNVGLVFFGFYCLLIGYLVFRSSFLPRTVGILMVFAGLGWLTFLVPPLASYLSPHNRIPGVLGEASLTLWLLIMGVNAEKGIEVAAIPDGRKS